MRIEKNKDKKLRGKRKRKEEALAADVSGTDFKIDLQDDRFHALLDGTDGRFGIDRTDPSFKETKGMRDLLKEQSKRRKSRGRSRSLVGKSTTNVFPENNTNVAKDELSSLVNRLKRNVKQAS